MDGAATAAGNRSCGGIFLNMISSSTLVIALRRHTVSVSQLPGQHGNGT
jgi:hypothetical protein